MPTIDELAEATVDGRSSEIPLRRQSAIEQDQIFSAIGYVMLAGMAYPGIFLLIAFVANTRVYEFSLEDLAVGALLFAMVTLAGGALGLVVAGIFGTLCAVLMVIFHYTTRCRFHPRTLVHFMGGMAGFWTVAILLNSGIGAGDWTYVFVASVLGMVLGQIATTVGYCRKHGEYVRKGEQASLQFSIFDMFVMVTWVAGALAFFRLFSTAVFQLAGVWMAIQIPLLLISHAYHRYYLRRSLRSKRQPHGRDVPKSLAQDEGTESKSTRTISVRATFLLLTAVGVVCAIEPLVGLAIFAFGPAIFGMVLIRNGLIKRDDTLSHHGVVCVAFGFVAGALLLAGFAQLFGL